VSGEQSPPGTSSPFWELAMGLVKRMPNETKQALVNTVASTLEVHPGFWSPDGEAPSANAAAVLDVGESRYLIGFHDGTSWRLWKNAPGSPDEPVTQTVKRWAIIPG
jgi:hypothetical protein